MLGMIDLWTPAHNARRLRQSHRLHRRMCRQTRDPTAAHPTSHPHTAAFPRPPCCIRRLYLRQRRRSPRRQVQPRPSHPHPPNALPLALPRLLQLALRLPTPDPRPINFHRSTPPARRPRTLPPLQAPRPPPPDPSLRPLHLRRFSGGPLQHNRPPLHPRRQPPLRLLRFQAAAPQMVDPLRCYSGLCRLRLAVDPGFGVCSSRSHQTERPCGPEAGQGGGC